MKVSIITVCYNAEITIGDTIRSVASQDYDDIEYIIVDGGSTDGTCDVIKRYGKNITTWISEPDEGIYDAMNKGISMASGDIIGILNADDFYVDSHIISTVVSEFKQKQVDSVFADLVVVDQHNSNKVVRYYRANHFTPSKFAYGWMPPHPTFFVKKSCYDELGLYKIDYEIAADYELLIRFLAVAGVSYSYIPKVLIKMRAGGVSSQSIKSNLTLNKEIIRACRENGISTNMFKVLSKYPRKFMEMILKPGDEI
ncbi:glycosyltransferase family 2 protein [Desulfobacterota bacterium M19]